MNPHTPNPIGQHDEGEVFTSACSGWHHSGGPPKVKGAKLLWLLSHLLALLSREIMSAHYPGKQANAANKGWKTAADT